MRSGLFFRRAVLWAGKNYKSGQTVPSGIPDDVLRGWMAAGTVSETPILVRDEPHADFIAPARSDPLLSSDGDTATPPGKIPETPPRRRRRKGDDP